MKVRIEGGPMAPQHVDSTIVKNSAGAALVSTIRTPQGFETMAFNARSVMASNGTPVFERRTSSETSAARAHRRGVAAAAKHLRQRVR